MQAVKDLMAPELRGRITATIVFDALGADVAKMIVNKELKKLSAKLKARGIAVTYTDSAIDEIVKRGVSAQYGAREIQKVIDNDVKKLFVKHIISGKTAQNYNVDFDGEQFIVAKVSAKPKKEMAPAI
jgi:ATP-dependent Clp protease ATP-binding subunit ClpA